MSSLRIAALLATSLFAQDAVTTLPKNYRVVLDNDYVRVVRVRYEPQEKLPVHDHPRTPTIYVYLTDAGPVRFSHVENRAFGLTRRPLKAGEFRVSPGRMERHLVENLGDIPTEFLRIELKRVPLGLERLAFRSKKVPDLTATATTEEFTAPEFSIQRLVLTHAGDVKGIATKGPVLLVAISQAQIRVASTGHKKVAAGELCWLEKQQRVQIDQVGQPPAHVLAVRLNHTDPK